MGYCRLPRCRWLPDKGILSADLAGLPRRKMHYTNTGWRTTTATLQRVRARVSTSPSGMVFGSLSVGLLQADLANGA